MASKWPFWLAFAFLLWICELTHGVRYPVENDTINPEVTPMYVPRGHKKGMVYEYTDCYGIAQDLHGKDNPCVFPFIYRGTTYKACTYVADSHPWCATSVDDNAHLVNNHWGYCTADCPLMNHNPCYTVAGGLVVGAFCRFPFHYKNVEYNFCTLVDSMTTGAWCATKVDIHGDLVPNHWGICQPECNPDPQDPDDSVEVPAGNMNNMNPGGGVVMNLTDGATSSGPATNSPTVLTTTNELTTSPSVSGHTTSGGPTTNSPATNAPATNTSATNAPVNNSPATNAPVTNSPATNSPATNAPVTNSPATNSPATNAPITNVPVTNSPATNSPATNAPVTNSPATNAPATNAPATIGPSTIGPATNAPATNASATNASATIGPATNSPATTDPDTDAPVTTASTMTPATCLSDGPTCTANCANDDSDALCLFQCTANSGGLCTRNCILGGSNPYCTDLCVEPPEECRAPVTSHIPANQAPGVQEDEEATYIPSIYSDPILEILRNSGIPVSVVH